MKTKAAVVWSSGKPLATTLSLTAQLCLRAEDFLRTLVRAWGGKESCHCLMAPNQSTTRGERGGKGKCGKLTSNRRLAKENNDTSATSLDKPFWLRRHGDEVLGEHLVVSVADSLLQFHYDTLPIKGIRK